MHLFTWLSMLTLLISGKPCSAFRIGFVRKLIPISSNSLQMVSLSRTHYPNELRNALHIRSKSSSKLFLSKYDYNSNNDEENNFVFRKWAPLSFASSYSSNDLDEGDDCGLDTPQSSTSTIGSLLICGDGDLSFSASTTDELEKLGLNEVVVTSTVLEDEKTHNEGKHCLFVTFTFTHNIF